VEDGWVSRCYGERTSAPVCRYTSQGEGAQEFITFMLPARVAEDAQVRRASYAGGDAYELRRETGNDVLLTCRQGSVVNERLASDFEWTWARFDLEGALTELVLINGHNCALDEQTIIESRAPIAYVYARRDSGDLIVEADGAIRHVTLKDSHAVVS
jgi:hypothetical protein